MDRTPSETLFAYVRAFETLHAEQVVPFYSLPCTFIRPDGVWVVQDEATALVLVKHLMDHAVSQGYKRTEVAQLTARPLASSLAELSGNFERFDESGAPIGVFGFTYLLRRVADQWQIVVAAAHDPVAAAGHP